MENILLIGAGQLGGRHLQGLLQLADSQRIYVLDPSQLSLEMAKQRSLEIRNDHQLFYVKDWRDLPKEFNIVIVSTNSDVREEVINNLCKNYNINYLILEKVLFQKIASYEKIGDLLSKRMIRTWVNHSRRMFASYQEIKQLIAVDTIKILQYSGGNWGLACNSLHFIDLFMFLTETELKQLDVSWIDDTIIPSKRKGFIEFTGSIRGELTNGSIFYISSLKGESAPGILLLSGTQHQIVILESGGTSIDIIKKEGDFKLEVNTFKMEYQSSLTTKLAEDLLDNNDCDLPTYEMAARTHKIFIREMTKKYNAITRMNHLELPIT